MQDRAIVSGRSPGPFFQARTGGSVDAYVRVRILDELELVTAQLLKDETLDAATFHRLIGLPPRDESAPRPRVAMPVPDVEVPAACGRASPV